MLFLSTPTVSAFDNSDERDGYTISDIKKLISNENQIEVYSEDGTMEIMDEPLSIYNEDSTVDLTNLRASTSFEEVKIVDSGKPDSESIVVTLMGDGFTATEQNNFINAANNAANYLIGNDSTGDQGFYPYNLFRDYFTIYAIKVISEESGVSRDANTNNGHIVNNYFGSSFYYGNNSSTTQRALVITKDDKARALEKSGSSMTAIICNSSRWGGTGGEFAVLSMHTNFGQILTHEFGHSFGGLADEYWYEGEPFRATEAVNKTQNGNLNTIKWKHWIGKSGIYSGIGAYRFSSNSSNTAYNWYKPHQNCQMQYSDEQFCAVCAEELIKRMEAKTGSFFETTSISDTQIKIDNVNYTLYNAFEIPPVLNGKEVVFIGSNAFKNQLNLTNIVIPSSVTNIDSSAFENCSYLQSVTLPANLVAIGSSAFKGCGSLASITIPNGVTNIDSSAFENCSYLQSVTLPTNLVSIGTSAFKGCGSLGSITIPNGVTNIDSSAFENCSYLQSVTLPTNLVSIGTSAFKGCGSLGSITIPSNVQYIDDSAFENCVSLVSVVVERGISNITNLGNYVFAGCSSTLQIIVPKNRIAEYKNKVYWSSYKNIIIPDNDNYDEIDLYCLIDDEKSVTLNAGYNKLYKLVVDCTKSYKFVTDTDTKINIYNLDMTNAYSGENTLIAYLNKGTYYLSIEYSSVTASGTININYELTYPTDGIAIAYNSSNGTNIASGLHLTENNMYHARLKYTNYNGAGFYKFTLNAGASAIYPVNAIQVYTDANRTNLLSMYSLSELDIFAQSNENENIMYIYLPENGTYYIDVTLPLSSYSSLTFNIQSIEVNNINYWNSLTSIGFDVLFENVNTQSCFEEVTISHRSEIQLDIISSGTIYNDIKVYVFEKVRDPGYDPGINYYYIESVYIDEITSTNRSPVFTLILDPGTYYFGYAENEDNVNINFALRRMVDYNMNMEGVLVADPYYTGYDLGTEVLFNEGECDKYYITEGFTRNIYLMVEDRLRDPMSRLDYDWYSSNEAVATVTNYGTVLAMPVTIDTEVTIYAVLKDDPKIVYYRTFTVLNDDKEDLIEIELNMSYSYVAENGTYQLELTNVNCPYPIIQYYSWNIINNCEETVIMNYWGQISSTGTCSVLIEGTYNLNSRVRLYITLTIE